MSTKEIAQAFAEVETKIDEDDETHEENWERVEAAHRAMTLINERRQKIWAELQELVPKRDKWHAEFQGTDAKSRAMMDSDLAVRGSKATNMSKQCKNLAFAHRMQRKRLMQLNTQITTLCEELCAIEKKYPLTDQSKLDDLYKAAVDDDAPKAMLAILERVRSGGT